MPGESGSARKIDVIIRRRIIRVRAMESRMIRSLQRRGAGGVVVRRRGGQAGKGFQSWGERVLLYPRLLPVRTDLSAPLLRQKLLHPACGEGIGATDPINAPATRPGVHLRRSSACDRRLQTRRAPGSAKAETRASEERRACGRVGVCASCRIQRVVSCRPLSAPAVTPSAGLGAHVALASLAHRSCLASTSLLPR